MHVTLKKYEGQVQLIYYLQKVITALGLMTYVCKTWVPDDTVCMQKLCCRVIFKKVLAVGMVGAAGEDTLTPDI